MAIGLGRIFGFRFPENFDHPYCAGSITEFWRRWHISLGSWFRDYLYIPLGGNRKGKARQLLDILLIVWLATGLWHGAAWNFVLWGLLFAVLLTMEKLWLLPRLEKRRVLGHVYVLFFVLLGFVLLRRGEPEGCRIVHLRAMFLPGGLPAISAESLYQLRSNALAPASGRSRSDAASAATGCRIRRKAARRRKLLAVLEPIFLAGAARRLHGLSGGRLVQSVSVFPVLRRTRMEKRKNIAVDAVAGGVPARASHAVGLAEARRRRVTERAAEAGAEAGADGRVGVERELHDTV